MTFQSRRFNSRNRLTTWFLCGLLLLALSGLLAAGASIAHGDEAPGDASDFATPLLDSSSFNALASHALTSEVPADQDLQVLKTQRFRELKGKIEELSGLLEKQREAQAAQPPENRSSNEPETIPHSQTTRRIPPPESRGTNGSAKSPVEQPGMRPTAEPGTIGESSPVTNESSATSDSALSGNGSMPPELSAMPFSRHGVGEQRRMGIVVEPSDQSISALTPDGRTLHPQIYSGPVDRFALASSLFGTGDIEACLSVLKQIDFKTLSREDQLWINYLQACCHRRAGRIDEARLLYRRIIAAPEADWMKDVSKWWLDNLDAKKTMAGDAQKLNTTLQAWEGEIANLGKK